jgi:drug/metabolite transporter (DMT)-like permease
VATTGRTTGQGPPEAAVLGALLALAAAVSFGASDVAGAVAARRVSSLTVTLGMQFVGLVALVPVLWLIPGQPSGRALWFGALAGLFGTGGVVLYFRSMAAGPIGVISPVAALVGAAVPVAWGVFAAGDELSPFQNVGVLAGLIAVIAVAYLPGSSLRDGDHHGPLAAVVAGATFGMFFVFLDATPDDSGLWPLLGSRSAGIVLVVALLVAKRRPALPYTAYGLVALSGVADVLANALFLLATRRGILSLVSLLASLYPVVALVVARLVLAERLSRVQAAGVVLALIATGLLVAG